MTARDFINIRSFKTACLTKVYNKQFLFIIDQYIIRFKISMKIPLIMNKVYSIYKLVTKFNLINIVAFISIKPSSTFNRFHYE